MISVSHTARTRAIAAAVMLVATLLVGPIPSLDAAPLDWTSNGPFGGQPTAFAIHPSDAGVVLAATHHGVFKTVDGGEHWQHSSRELPSNSIRSITFDQHKPSIAYAGGYHGFFRSTDGGTTWKAARIFPVNTSVEDILASEQHDGRVYAIQSWGIYRSNDYGATWRQILEGNPLQIRSMVVAPSNNRIAYLSAVNNETGADALYRSGDAGETWSRLPLRVGAWSPAVHHADPDVVYVTADDAILRSTNGGDTWTPVWHNSSYTAGYANQVTVSKSAPARVYIQGLFEAGTFVAASADAGATWDLTRLPVHQTHAAIEVHPTKAATVYYGAAEGVLKSEDGGSTFRRRNHGLRAASPTALDSDPENPSVLYAALGAGGLYLV